jgi:hypothetical protein
VTELPMAAAPCALTDVELRDQLARYRLAGEGAEVIEWEPRRKLIRLADAVPDAVVERMVQVEQACCPFFELDWDRTTRRLSISVSQADREPALQAIGDALGVA